MLCGKVPPDPSEKHFYAKTLLKVNILTDGVGRHIFWHKIAPLVPLSRLADTSLFMLAPRKENMF